MKPMDLFDELTYIDEGFVLEAHETPAPRHSRLTLRRAAVLLAAVIAAVVMSVAAVATMTEDMDAKLLSLWSEMAKDGYYGYFGYDDNYRYELHRYMEELDDREVEIGLVHFYNLSHAELRVFCEGETLEVKLEAMVLMDDGQVKYKSRTIQGDGEVTVTVDNLIAGEPGVIVHLQRTISLLGQEGWMAFSSRSNSIAGEFGYQVPIGTDIRFPNKRYNYDGRAPQGAAEEEQDASIYKKNTRIALEK